MRITVDKSEQYKMIEVAIKAPLKEHRIDAMISALELFDASIYVKDHISSRTIALEDVYYFEFVDRKVFCYTKEKVYETKLKLYEIENTFQHLPIVRISKSMIVNINKIVAIKSQINGRLLAYLENDEVLEISRKYKQAVKAKYEVMAYEKK